MISESVKINELMGKGKSEIMKWWDDDDMAFEAQQWVDWQVTWCEVTFCQVTSGQVTLFTSYLMDKLPYDILPFTTNDLFS